MKEFIEDIKDRTRTNFKVTAIPVGVLKEFKEYCKEECGNVYAVGIYQLLKMKKQYEELIPILSSIHTEVLQMKESQNNLNTKEIRTFGE